MSDTITVREGSAEAEKPLEQSLLLPGEHERLQAVQASSKFLVPVGTQWVENDVLGVAEEINRRWPNLRVASCACGHCGRKGHYPHVVMEHTKDGRSLPVFGFFRLNREVIHRLQAIHVSQDPQAKHEQMRDEFRAEGAKRRQEAQREDMEVIEAALRSHKSNWTGPNGLRTNPHGRVL